MGKEALEFVEELCREGLVGRQNERGLACAGYDVGHGVRLTRSGYSHEHLMFQSLFNPAGQRVDGLWLVSTWDKVGYELEHGHRPVTKLLLPCCDHAADPWRGYFSVGSIILRD